MIRFFWVFLIVLLLGIEGNAQTKTYVGVKGGGNISILLMQNNFFRTITNPRYNSGVHSGIIVKHYNRKNFGIQTGVEYIQKGWNQYFFDFFPTYSARIDYIEAPFLMNVYLGNGKAKFFVNMGIFVEYLIGSKLDDDPGDVEPFNFFTYDEERDGRFGYGLRGGGGFSYDFPFGQVHLEGFFSYSLTNLFDPVNNVTLVPNNSKSFVIGISAAYLLPFGKLNLLKD